MALLLPLLPAVHHGLEIPQWWWLLLSCALRSFPAPLSTVSSMPTLQRALCVGVCVRLVVGVEVALVGSSHPLSVLGWACGSGPSKSCFLVCFPRPPFLPVVTKLCFVLEVGCRPKRVSCSLPSAGVLLCVAAGQEGFLSLS